MKLKSYITEWLILNEYEVMPPEKKDMQRIKDIVKKANKDQKKAEQLAFQMANSIDNPGKAWRRYLVCKDMKVGDAGVIDMSKLKKIFHRRYITLKNKLKKD